MRRRVTWATLTMLLVGWALLPASAAITPHDIAVVANVNAAFSEDVAAYYCERMGIPPSNILRVNSSPAESVNEIQFADLVSSIRDALVSQLCVDPDDPANDPIQVLVMCHGVPNQIWQGGIPSNATTSVDSYLTLLFNTNPDLGPETLPTVLNPYWNQNTDFASFRASPENSITYGPNTYRMRYLVCRIEANESPLVDVSGYGAMPRDLRNMIDHAAGAVNQTGRFVLDEAWHSDGGYGLCYSGTADALQDIVAPELIIRDGVIPECYVNMFQDPIGVIGYASYGMHDSDILVQTDWGRPYFNWKPGAVAIIEESYGGVSIRNPSHVYWPADPAVEIAEPTLLLTAKAVRDTYVKTLAGYRMALLDGEWGELKSAVIGSDGVAEIDLTDPEINWPPPNQQGHVVTIVQVYYPDDDHGYHDGQEICYSLYFCDGQEGRPDLYQLKQQGRGLSLTLDLCRQRSAEYITGGCSAVNAAVAEPGGTYTASGITFPRYAAGYSWGEAAYMGLYQLGFKWLFLGDPLMAPFARGQPTVTFTEPAEMASVSGYCTVGVNAQPVDNAEGIARVDFWLTRLGDDGYDLYEHLGTVTQAPFQCSLNSTLYQDGVYTLRVVAYEDNIQREAGEATRRIVIQNGSTSASIEITDPQEDEIVSDWPAVTAQVFGSADVSKVELWLAGYPWRIDIDQSAPYTMHFDTTTHPDGPCDLYAVAYCTDGSAFSSSPRSVTIDNAGIVSFVEPAIDGVILGGEMGVVVSVNSAGQPPVHFVRLLLADGSSETEIESMLCSPYITSVDFGAYPDGVYQLRAVAYKEGMEQIWNKCLRTIVINNDHIQYGSIAEVRGLADSTPVLMELKPVSAGTSDTMGEAFYIEEPDRFAGIRVQWPGSIPTGRLVTVLGTVANAPGTDERQILAEGVFVSDASSLLRPLGMNNLAVGGSSPNQQLIAGVTDVFGLFNTGSLITTFGRVRYTGLDFMYIDDGSGIFDGNALSQPWVVPGDGSPVPAPGTGISGIRAYFGGLPMPGLDDTIMVSGISSLMKIGDNHVRLLRVRDETDVTYGFRYVPGCVDFDGTVIGPDGPLPEGSPVSLVNKSVSSVEEDAFWITEDFGGSAKVNATTALVPLSVVTVNGILDYNPGPEIDPHDPLYPPDTLMVYLVGVPGGGQSGPNSWSAGAGMTAMPYSNAASLDGGGPFDPYPTSISIQDSPFLASVDSEPGSIGYVVGQLDGTVLDLIGVQVLATSDEGRTIGLKESFEPAPKSPRLALRLEKAVETL